MHVDDERLLTLNVISLNKYYSSNHTHCRAAHTTEKWKCSIYTHGQAFMCRLHAYNKTSMILQHKYSTTFHHHVPVNTHVHDVASVYVCIAVNKIIYHHQYYFITCIDSHRKESYYTIDRYQHSYQQYIHYTVLLS